MGDEGLSARPPLVKPGFNSLPRTRGLSRRISVVLIGDAEMSDAKFSVIWNFGEGGPQLENEPRGCVFLCPVSCELCDSCA